MKAPQHVRGTDRGEQSREGCSSPKLWCTNNRNPGKTVSLAMTFLDFLQRNSVRVVDAPPACHSTQSYNIKAIIRSGHIEPKKCDVFNEEMTYFFVGKPAYKAYDDNAISKRWQLPCCFIFEYSSISEIKRIFPFDSGAFYRGIYPKYISMMDIEEFNIASAPDAPSRVISAFFGSFENYFSAEPRSRESLLSECMVTEFNDEIEAFHSLCHENDDDRKCAIEVQSTSGVDISRAKLLAVIAPIKYGDIKEFRDFISLHDARLITYNVYSLNSHSYYSEIYGKYEMLMKELGLL